MGELEVAPSGGARSDASKHLNILIMLSSLKLIIVADWIVVGWDVRLVRFVTIL